jgi:hypothetical protein
LRRCEKIEATKRRGSLVTEPELVKKPPATLKNFIEDQSKLVTSIAAFIALTAFSGQLDDAEIKFAFPALTLLGAALLTWELVGQLPERPREWKLELFSLILPIMVFLMARYWFFRFPTIWVPVVGTAVEMLIFFGLAIGLTVLITKCIGFTAARLFKRPIPSQVMTRVSQVGFVAFCLLVVFAFGRVSQALASHPLKIHVPTWLVH